jgi:hypothetical protein
MSTASRARLKPRLQPRSARALQLPAFPQLGMLWEMR